MGDHTILSFYAKDIYNNKEVKEYLVEHIELGLNNIEKMDESFISKIVKIINIPYNDFVEWLKLAFIFHDSGKIFYQNNYRKEKSIIKLSFLGHEIFSTLIFDIFMENYIKQNIDIINEFLFINNNTKYIKFNAISFSILYHHHPMNIKRRINYATSGVGINKLNIDNLRELSQFFILDLKKYNDAFIKIFEKLDIGRIFTNYKEKITNINNTIWKSIISSSNFKKLSFLLLALLISLDYTSIKRQVSKVDFLDTVREFNKIYLGL